MTGQFQKNLKESIETGELALPSQRLKAAMIRAGRQPVYTELVKLLQEKRGVRVNKQTAHNWFKPTSKFIDPKYLFDIASALEISARWLTTGSGRIDIPRYLTDDEADVLGLLEAFGSNRKAKERWIKEGHDLLDMIGHTGKTHPYTR